ncbi:Amino-acid acetyltransferase, mitochondrial [Coemansia sp. RSA 1722]|nr:Amino-acid acetyltransferase, mitochondrial [Coemansia sp. RSA 1722]KAJ2639010.1 Amino-acid acetyltransferase, mitochondrial [Coemansia sp. RSA 1286]
MHILHWAPAVRIGKRLVSTKTVLCRQLSSIHAHEEQHGQEHTHTAASVPALASTIGTSVVPRNQRERELILSVLSTVPSPREARKFLNSVSGNETMRSQREFEEQQAKLAASEQPQVPAPAVVPGEILQPNRNSQADTQRQETISSEGVPRRLTAVVFVDSAMQDTQACDRTGKLLAQIQRLGVAPVVLLSSGKQSGYRDVIRGVHRLADAIEREGGRARPVNEGVFYNNPYGASQASVDPELIGSAIAQGQVPIVSPLVASASMQMQMLDIDSAAPALAKALAVSSSQQRPMAGTNGGFSLLLARLIMLGANDGISSSDGGFHRFINLQEDYDEVLNVCQQRESLQLMRTCLGILPPTAAGIVASVHSDPSLVIKGLISERPVSSQHQSAATAAKRRQEEANNARKLAELSKRGVPSYKPLANYPFARVSNDKPNSANSPEQQLESADRPTQFTLLRHGFRIARHKTLDTCDLSQLRALLESSFKRTLDSNRYFDRLRHLEQAGGIEIIVAGDYQGAVIVTHEPITTIDKHLPYLDKFAVLPSVQGTGMADILWTQLRRACPSCMWRSRNDNGVNKWYFDRSHGHLRSRPLLVGEKGTRWVFFWYQAAEPGQRKLTTEEIHAGIAAANSIPPSFL